MRGDDPSDQIERWVALRERVSSMWTNSLERKYLRQEYVDMFFIIFAVRRS